MSAHEEEARAEVRMRDSEVRMRDGFVGQRMWVVPKPWLQSLPAQPILHSLQVTDIGWFPNARFHYRERPKGAEEHIVIFCSAGSGWCDLAGIRSRIDPGEALVIPRGAPHTYWADAETPWSIHWVHFSGIVGDLILSELGRGQTVLPVDPQSARAIVALFGECFEAFAGGFVPHRMLYSAQVLHHILGRLFYANARYSPLQRAHQSRALEPTLTYLHKNSTRKLTLKEIADHAGVSVSHLSSLFRKQTGLSPMDYLIRYRMQRACSLLAEQSMGIQQVAWEVGYSDSYYFSRLFKKVIGISPLYYRQQRLGQRSSAEDHEGEEPLS